MQNTERTDNAALQSMWKANRAYLRQFLIGLSRDIDLAEDMLQETYLSASRGLEGYRGGSERAWLAAIARNAFLTHARRRHVRSERPMLDDTLPDQSPGLGSQSHILSIELRRSVDALSPTLRAPLLLKHYGGFSYQEIADRLGCPVGTARRRVWNAIRKLKAALGVVEERMPKMRCANVRGSRLLDYLSGSLPSDQAAKFKDHLDNCPECRQQAQELRQVVSALDAAEDEYKSTEIIELHPTGVATHYQWRTFTNRSEHAMTGVSMSMDKDWTLDYNTVQGEELDVDVGPCSDQQFTYGSALPEPVQPGGRIDVHNVIHPNSSDHWACRIGSDHWAYAFQTNPNAAREWVQVLAIRLPVGAKLVSATPDPSKVKSNGTTTIIWRSYLPRLFPTRPEGWTSNWQFECQMEYALKSEAPAPETTIEPSEWAKAHVRWMPEIVLDIENMPVFESPEPALKLYSAAKVENADLPCRNWFRLGMALWKGEYYAEAMDSFERVCSQESAHPEYRFAAYSWRGQIFDTLGRRDEALQEYEQALTADIGDDGYMQHSKIDMWIDRRWVAERLKTPFDRRPHDEYWEAHRGVDP